MTSGLCALIAGNWFFARPVLQVRMPLQECAVVR